MHPDATHAPERSGFTKTPDCGHSFGRVTDVARPGRARILALASAGKIEAVLVGAVERWSRDEADTAATLAWLEWYGVALMTRGSMFDRAVMMIAPVGRRRTHGVLPVDEGVEGKPYVQGVMQAVHGQDEISCSTD